MNVHVVVAVYSGCVQDVDVFTDKVQADRAADTAKKELGIVPGEEAESEHDVKVFERVVI